MEREEKLARLRETLEQYAEDPASGLFDLRAEEAKAPVRKRALALLNARSRSQHELRERLLALEFPPEVVDAVIADFLAAGMLDDAAFAEEWVRSRHDRRGKSVRVLDRELADKGVDASVRAAALAEISVEEEHAVAWRFAQKKAATIKSVPADWAEKEKWLRRITGVLARRGYGEGMSLSLARQALEERVAELEDS